ncbi:hypothetical protein ADUPG1_010932 [Aduncisulcus paluster]|uniref:Uncharacterized protein n=1 Tax=Aduncisulcus paluster TaxID=2918883 RepID=A0ABQ5JXG4_9EUKA|nr:hypothetical protein ADUPG1_010932 [Aduncisulcus paluster]
MDIVKIEQAERASARRGIVRAGSDVSTSLSDIVASELNGPDAFYNLLVELSRYDGSIRSYYVIQSLMLAIERDGIADWTTLHYIPVSPFGKEHEFYKERVDMHTNPRKWRGLHAILRNFNFW